MAGLASAPVLLPGSPSNLCLVLDLALLSLGYGSALLLGDAGGSVLGSPAGLVYITLGFKIRS